MQTVAGIFSLSDEAQQALSDLRALGIDPERVSVIVRDPARAREVAAATGAEVQTGVAAGGVIGAILGGAAGWLVGAGAWLLPGIGAIVAAGPLAVAIGAAATAQSIALGAAAGSAIGALAGALAGWGFSEAEVREFEVRMQRGDLLVIVEVSDDDDARLTTDILRRAGADHIVATEGSR